MSKDTSGVQNKKNQGGARRLIEKWGPIGIWIAAIFIVVYCKWIKPEDDTLKDALIDISTLVPLFLLIASLTIETGGYIVSGIMLAERLWRERQERKRKAKEALKDQEKAKQELYAQLYAEIYKNAYRKGKADGIRDLRKKSRR